DDANWHPETEEDKCATGTMIGSGIGGLNGIADTAILLKERGPRRVSPFFIPGRLINLASGYVSIKHGLKGPNHSVVTPCLTSARRRRRLPQHGGRAQARRPLAVRSRLHQRARHLDTAR